MHHTQLSFFVCNQYLISIKRTARSLGTQKHFEIKLAAFTNQYFSFFYEILVR